jgi:hypothetical protein
VLDTLTDVDACEAWSPVPFEVEDRGSSRLRTGTTTTVSGRLAGRAVRFRVDVCHADAERLVVRARGPVEMTATYVVRPSHRGAQIEAAISISHPHGVRAAVTASATSLLLAAGALDHTLRRIAREAENRHNSEGPAGGEAFAEGA